MALVNKSKLRETIKELDKENSISSVAEDVGIALERKVEKILEDAINRASANKRRTIQPRDL